MRWAARARLGLQQLVASEHRLASMVSSIIGSQLVTGLLGFVFWGLAARTFPHASVGAAGAAVAAIALVASLGQVGQGALVVSELLQTPPEEQRGLLRAARRAVIVSGVVAGLVVFALTSGQGAFADFSAVGLGYAVAVLTCALVSEANLHDGSMLVVDAPRNQVLRNTVSSAVRILLLAAASLLPNDEVGPTSTLLLACWAAGWIPSNLMARVAITRHTSSAPHSPALTELRCHVRRYGRAAAQHQGISLALASGFLLQPVVIGAFISRDDNARFTAVRLGAGLVLLVPYAIASAVFTASTDGQGDLRLRSRRATRLSLVVSLVLYAGVLVVAEPVVVALGGRFAAPGADALRIMCAAGPALVFKDQYIAVARTLRRLSQALVVVGVGAALEVIGIAVGVTLFGLEGALTGWVLVLAVEALVCNRLLHRAFAAGDYFGSATSAS